MNVEHDVFGMLRLACQGDPDAWARITELHDEGTIRGLIDARLPKHAQDANRSEEYGPSGEPYETFVASIVAQVLERAA